MTTRKGMRSVAQQRRALAGRGIHLATLAERASGARTHRLFSDIGPRPRSCRWIEGEPDGARTVYCDRPRDQDPDYTGCYCPHHREIARRSTLPPDDGTHVR